MEAIYPKKQPATKSQSAEAMLKQLKNPFPTNLLHFRIGAKSKDKTKAIPLAYLTMRDIQKRLDEVCGMDGWTKDTEIIASNGVVVAEKTTLSIKMPNGDWISKDGIGEPTKIAGPLGAESQSFKRAAVAWGISRYLYFISLGYRPIDKYNQFTEDLTKSLPKWALPDSNVENWEDVAELEYSAEDSVSEDEPNTPPDELELVERQADARKDEIIKAAKANRD